MSGKKRKNSHVGGDVMADMRAMMANDRELARAVELELAKLELARRVRELRQKRGLTQDGLARMVGTKQPAIARIENGRGLPKLELLERIALATGMRLHLEFIPAR